MGKYPVGQSHSEKNSNGFSFTSVYPFSVTPLDLRPMSSLPSSLARQREVSHICFWPVFKHA